VELNYTRTMESVISKVRTQFLTDNFFEFSFDDREPDKDVFDQITSPSELHFIAETYNWDDGTEVLSWIINSTICDKATARLIFWRSQPDFYTAFLSEEEAGYEAQTYTLLRNIIDNFAMDFYKSERIAYDPRKDPGAPSDINYRNAKEKWQIPLYLKAASEGIEIQYEV
jgi:hypothetical protein